MDSLIADKRQELEHFSRNSNRTNVTLRINLGKDVKKDILLRFRNEVSRPTLLSGGKRWPLGKAEGGGTEASEMRSS
jgi:hypothetical protein